MTLNQISKKHKIPYIKIYMSFMDKKKELNKKGYIKLNEDKKIYDVNTEGENLIIKDLKADSKKNSLFVNSNIPKDFLELELLQQEQNLQLFDSYVRKNTNYEELYNPEVIIELLKQGNQQSNPFPKKVLIEFLRNNFPVIFEKYLMDDYVLIKPSNKSNKNKFHYFKHNGKTYINIYSTNHSKAVLPRYINKIKIYDTVDKVFIRKTGDSYYYFYKIPMIEIKDFLKYYIPHFDSKYYLKAVNAIMEKEGISPDFNDTEEHESDEIKNDTFIKGKEPIKVLKEIKEKQDNKTKSESKINSLKTNDNLQNRMNRIETYLERILDILGG